MKSGTSSLHHILCQHERIFMPAEEIHFFSMDDFFQHPRFSVDGAGGWVTQDYESLLSRNLSWYGSFFAGARPDQLVGEDSTVYLASPRAPARIAGLLPEVRIIFLLRDPVARCYSEYWHLLRTGRIAQSFESVLRISPHLLLSRSLYKEQLIRYFSVFDRSRVKVLVFESFIRDLQNTTDEVLDFLGLPQSLDVTGVNTHQNPSPGPRVLPLQYLHNLLFASILRKRQGSHLWSREHERTSNREGLLRKAESALRHLNSAHKPCPPMRRETQSFLEDFLARENDGLSRLIGIDVGRYWPYMA